MKIIKKKKRKIKKKKKIIKIKLQTLTLVVIIKLLKRNQKYPSENCLKNPE
jgi:hypothetical protein